jgi:dTMP kinase
VADTRPDLTLVLDVSPEAGLARRDARAQGADRYETMDPAFHRRVTAAYRAIAKADPDRCALIDATPEVDTVAAAIRARVAERLGVAF